MLFLFFYILSKFFKEIELEIEVKKHNNHILFLKKLRYLEKIEVRETRHISKDTKSLERNNLE